MVLVIAETLEHGMRAGVKVAIAPLLTDLPILVLVFLVLNQLQNLSLAMMLINLAGACLLVYFGVVIWNTAQPDLEASPVKQQSLKKGVIANFLNPNPYLFWLLIGGPSVLAAWAESRFAAVGYLIVFYGLLVGAKVGVALLVGRSRKFLQGTWYRRVMRVLSVLLIAYAWVFLDQAIMRWQSL